MTPRGSIGAGARAALAALALAFPAHARTLYRRVEAEVHAALTGREVFFTAARVLELDAGAIAPRLELAKLYVQQEREGEARPVLAETAAIPARSEVDRRMVAEARQILAGLGAPAPASHP